MTRRLLPFLLLSALVVALGTLAVMALCLTEYHF